MFLQTDRDRPTNRPTRGNLEAEIPELKNYGVGVSLPGKDEGRKQPPVVATEPLAAETLLKND